MVEGICKPYQKPSATLDAGEQVGLRVLKPLGKDLSCDFFEASSVDLTRLGGVAAKKPALEHFQSGYGEPLAA